MKLSLLPVVVLMLFGCTPAAPVSQQKMLLLPDGQVQVNGITGDLAGALSRLGSPAATQVNITGCSNLPFSAIQKVKEAVESAGYSRIGFAAAEGPDLALCQAGR